MPARRALVALALAAVATGSAAGAPAGAAAASWSAPARLAEPALVLDSAGLLQDARGRLVAAWSFRREAHAGVVVRTRLPGHAWTEARTLGLEIEYAQPGRRSVGVGPGAALSVFGADRMLAVGGDYVIGGHGRLVAWDAAATGRLRTSQVIGRDPWEAGTAAAGAGGAAVVAWTSEYGRRRLGGNLLPRVVRVAVRRAGRRFAPERRLSPVPPGPPYGGGRGPDLSATNPHVAFGGRTVVVAWQRAGRIEARVSRDGGRTFGPVRRVAGTASWYPGLSVAVGGDGTAVVAWSSHPTDPCGASRGPVSYAAAVLRADGTFAPPRTLESYDFITTNAYELTSGGRVAAAITATGTPLVAWEGFADGRYAVRVTALRASGAVGTVTTFAAPAGATGAVFDDLAVAPTGATAAVAWHVAGPPPFTDPADPSVAVTDASGAWGPGERVAQVARAREVQVAVGPQGATATWVAPLPGDLGQALFTADRRP